MNSSSHNLLLHRVFQYLGLILVFAALAGGYWYWKQARAAQTIVSNTPSFEAPLTTSLDLSSGVGGPTFSRADGADRRATVTDFEGRIIPVKQNEARFEGARRAENAITNSEAFNNWSTVGSVSVTTDNSIAPNSTQTAERIVFNANGSGNRVSSNDSSFRSGTLVASVWLKGSAGGEQIVLWNGWSGSATVTLATNWQRYSYSYSANSTSNFIMIYAVSGTPTIYIWGAQLEEVTGQANQNPSEYVSCGVKTSAPYHGANVDCVKYFDTQNGNTVASNVVTEATGAKIASSTLKGYFAEGSRTNLALQSEDFSTTWSGAATLSANSTAAPSGLVTADTMTDSSAAAYESKSQSFTVANDSSTHTFSIFVKKTTGGTSPTFGVNMSLSGGTATSNTPRLNTDTGAVSGGGATATLIGGYWRFSLSLANNSTGNTSLSTAVYPATAAYGSFSDTVTATGSAIVWGAQLEQAAFASSYIPTTTASVTRASDELSYLASGNISDQAFTASVEFIRTNNTSGAQPNKSPFSVGNYNSNASLQFGGYASNNVNSLANFGTTWSLIGSGGSYSYGAATRVAFRLNADLSTTNLFTNGTKYSNTSTDVKSTSWSGGSSARIYMATNNGGGDTNQNINIKNVRIWKKALSDTELQNMTSATDTVSQSAVQETTIKAPDNTGLVGYWSFEDGSGTKATDFSLSGANDGTLTNGPTWVDGKFGTAVSFDGTDDKISGGSFTVPTTTTVSAWIKKNASTTQKSFFSNRGGTGKVYFGIKTTQVYFYDNAGSPAGVESSVGSIQIGQWQHVVATSDGLTTKLYVNGTLVYSASQTRSASTGSSFGIGWDPNLTTEYWDGSIDEVRVYDRVLSATEISGLYQSTASAKVNVPSPEPLKNRLSGYWKFDDGSGSSLADSSLSGQTGTTYNSPSWTTGSIGGGLSFNGSNNYATLPDSEGWNFGNKDFAIAFWWKPTALGSNQVLLDWGTYGGSYVGGLIDYVTSTGLRVDIYYDDTSAQELTSVFTPTAGNWYHIVLTRNNENIDLYVNNSKVGGLVTSKTIGNNSGLVYLGRESSGAFGRYMNGVMDELRVYDKGLSQAEISTLYRSTAVDTPDLVGYWSFNGPDLSGTTVYDRSGKKNNGTLTNGPSIYPGKMGQGLNFDGVDDYVTVANASSINMGSGDFTISFWYRNIGKTGNDNILSKGVGAFNVGGNGWEFRARTADASMEFCVTGGGTCPRASGSGGVAGEWKHVAAVVSRTGTLSTLYINGSSVGSMASAPTYTDTFPFVMGSGSDSKLSGLIDEVRIYNRALSATEIASLYNMGR